MARSFLFAALLATGCTQWTYFPVTAPPAVTVEELGRRAASYPMPPASPHGYLRVIGYGIEKLSTEDADIPTLHVRLVAVDGAQVPWTIDTRQQSVELPFGTEAPAFAIADGAGDASQPPVVNLTTMAMRVIDLFFPVPDGTSASDIASFRVHTVVHTDEGDASETTTFDRTSVSIYYGMEDAQLEDDDYAYWDSPVWFNEGFVGVRGMVVSHGWHGRVYAHPTVWGRSSSHGGHWSGGGGRSGHNGSRGGHWGGHSGGGHSSGGHR